MDGILIIDKPADMTSHDVVDRVRRVLGTRRVGHTGTLDPFATGVMVILVGKATRLARFLDKDVKEYVAEIQFGSNTDTGDSTGSPIADSRLPIEEIAPKLKLVIWDDVLAKFRGEILQTPPMYSAKKIEGKKLYELARQGIQVERKPVGVVIHELELLPSEIRDPQSAIRIKVVCSAGTYIRTLAEDIGASLGIGAHLVGLRRVAAGKFTIEQSTTLEKLADTDPNTVLLPVEDAVSHLPKFDLSEDRIEKTRNGLSSRVGEDGLPENGPVRMVSGSGELIAIGVYDEAEKSIRPKVVLI